MWEEIKELRFLVFWSGLNKLSSHSDAEEMHYFIAATWDPFYLHGLTVIPTLINNYIHYKIWDEITYPFLNFKGCTVEV